MTNPAGKLRNLYASRRADRAQMGVISIG